MVRYWEKAEFVAWTQKLTLAKCIRIYFACQLWKLPIPLSSLLFKLVFAFWFTSIASGNISVHSSSLPPTFRSTPQGCPVLSSPLLKLDSHSRTFRSSPIFLHVYNYLPRWSSFFPTASSLTTPCASRAFPIYHLAETIYIDCLRFVTMYSGRIKPRRCCIYQTDNYTSNKNSSSELKIKENPSKINISSEWVIVV
jgi:hypothetical protein